MGWDWQKFWSDIQGPLTVAFIPVAVGLIGLIGAILTHIVRWLCAKVTGEQAKASSSLIDAANAAAETVVASLNQKYKGLNVSPEEIKAEAMEAVDNMTPKTVSLEVVDHAIEAKVAEKKSEKLHPSAKIDASLEMK